MRNGGWVNHQVAVLTNSSYAAWLWAAHGLVSSVAPRSRWSITVKGPVQLWTHICHKVPTKTGLERPVSQWWRIWPYPDSSNRQSSASLNQLQLSLFSLRISPDKRGAASCIRMSHICHDFRNKGVSRPVKAEHQIGLAWELIYCTEEKFRNWWS